MAAIPSRATDLRAVRLLADVRDAKLGLERLVGGWPFDPVLSRALDRLVILEAEALDAIARIAEARRHSA